MRWPLRFRGMLTVLLLLLLMFTGLGVEGGEAVTGAIVAADTHV